MPDDPLLVQARAEAKAVLRAALAAGNTNDDAVEAARALFLEKIKPFFARHDEEADIFENELWQIARAPAHLAAPTDAAARRATPPTPRPPLNVPPTSPTSPFRFVPLNDVVVPPQPDIARGLDDPLPGGFCGAIEVEWAAETPLLIGEMRYELPAGGGTKKVEVAGPMRLGKDGPWIIPGSTIRGCLRAALEIVAGGRLTQINAHHRYGLRDFDHPLIRGPQGDATQLLARENVKAGWLRRGESESGYEIVPCAEWRTIAIADLPFRAEPNEYQWRSDWLGKRLDERYALAGARVDSRTIRFDLMATGAFSAVAGGVGDVTAAERGELTGTLVFSNRSPAAPGAKAIKQAEEENRPGQPKKREYVFIDPPGAAPAPIAVSQRAWNRFELINCKPGRHRREPDGSWRDLRPSLEVKNGRVPVFYVYRSENGQPAELEFGLTRFFKIAHRFSVGELRDRSPRHRRPHVTHAKDFALDFVEMLFGYVYETDDVFDPPTLADTSSARPADLSRKGRVACGMARLLNRNDVKEGDALATVMTAPRASFAPFYLQGEIKDYSEANSATQLAGRKRYFPRFSTEALAGAPTAIANSLHEQITRLGQNAQANQDIQSRLRLLRPKRDGQDMRFAGTLRLHNVSAAEIGGLLWVLTHGGDPGKPYRHMLGRAKPFGAGQMRVCSIKLNLVSNDGATAPLAAPQPWERADPAAKREGWVSDGPGMTPFLRAFHTYMKTHRPTWPRVPDLVEFLAAAEPARGAQIVTSGSARYPTLESNEFGALRGRSKLSIRFAPPRPEPKRYLPVLSEEERRLRMNSLTLPYQSDPPSNGG